MSYNFAGGVQNLLIRRNFLMRKERNDMGRWKEVATAFLEEGQNKIEISGFNAERIRVSAMVAVTTADTKGLGIFLDDMSTTRVCLIGNSINQELMPIQFELGIVGNYTVSTAFQQPKNVGLANSATAYQSGCKLPNGWTSLKSVWMSCVNGQLAVGSWLKVEVWEQ